MLDHGLGYRALKGMAADALRHAFADDATTARLLARQAALFEQFEARYPSRRSGR